MKSRVEIKEAAKNIVKGNYTMALLPYVICAALTGVASAILPGIGGLFLLPLAVGMRLVYLMLWKGENPSLDIMFTSAFQENYGRKLGGSLLVMLYTWLWSLLFVIPGIIKSYSYSAAGYILAKYPNVTADNAIKLSMRIMDGHKMDLFVMQLSFIGWQLLGILTFGLLNIFWVTPYQVIAEAGCFDEFLTDALENGRVDASELA